MDLNLHSNTEKRFQQPIHKSLKLSIIVPAKNEANFVTHALDALRNQYDESGQPVPHEIYEVLVLANNCSDDTFKICEHYQSAYPEFRLHTEAIELSPANAHIGTVRRILMDAAYCRLMRKAGPRGVIVSTDSDSKVDKHWVHNIMLEMDKGVDVVGGRILPGDTPALAKIHHLRDVTYRFLRSRLEAELDPCTSNPWPRHFQCYGPSLAVTCEIYERAGRLPAIPYLEDEEFRKALKRVDAKIRHAPKVRIHTSSRLLGRVAFGFSVQLQQWNDMSINREQQMVEPLQRIISVLLIKNELRRLWASIAEGFQATIDIKSFAFKINYNAHKLELLINESSYFEPLWEQIEKHLMLQYSDLNALQPISVAIQEFRVYFANNAHHIVRRKTDLLAAVAL
ncbi:glycosyltransferase [Pedobacter rhodius]|uniref:Glycosyltransferase family A protein n=1 Tax=Pedobacter rhodius TaxID=3004098 RepID=A0ABT4KUV4_9SPHI|nr:glycosyltransferase family A protein [Pedobacter sp. SJ11]MCZ4222541.1 glycosyltransferase family A protein [Pedobacter sp. SJ11]